MKGANVNYQIGLLRNSVKFSVKKLVFFSIIVFPVLAYIFSEKSPELHIESGKESISKTARFAISVPSQSRYEVQASKKCIVNPRHSLMIEGEFSSIKQTREKIWEIKENLKGKPQQLVEGAHSALETPSAELYAIALFDLADRCSKLLLPNEVYRTNSSTKNSQFEELGCKALPNDIIGRPLTVLDKWIAKESTLAKTFYLIHALELAPIYQQLGSQEHMTYAREILTKAEKLGFELARKGVKEANFLMAGAYAEGSFGDKDMTKAASYLIPIEVAEGNKEHSAFLNKINLKLNASEQVDAQNIARGCTQHEDTSLISPFN